MKRFALVGGVLALAACRSEASAPPPPPVPPHVDPATATAILEVRAVLKGEPPRMRNIIFSDPHCAKAHPDPVPDPTVIVRDGRLANVIVWVSKGAEGLTCAPATEASVLELTGCMFVPHVLTLQTGQPLAVRNLDPVIHCVHVVPRINEESNSSIPKGAPEKVLSFPVEEVPIRAKSDCYGWMRCWIGVFAHPFHGVTDDRGEAFLRLPPGEYEVSVWHEYGKFTKPAPRRVTVAEGATAEIEFVYESQVR